MKGSKQITLPKDFTGLYPCVYVDHVDAQQGYVSLMSVTVDKSGKISTGTITSYCQASQRIMVVYHGVVPQDVQTVGQTYLDAWNAYYGTNFGFGN